MILVTGSVTARQDTFDEVRRLSLEHVQRSRKEPGCISHAVHIDCENPLRPRAILSGRCSRSPLRQQRSSFTTLPGWKNYSSSLFGVIFFGKTLPIFSDHACAWLRCPTKSYIALQHWLH